MATNKNNTITANKIFKKYKNMKKPKKTILVNKKDLDSIKYIENDQEIDEFSKDEDLFAGESILNAANKVFDFKKFKETQYDAKDYFKKFNEENSSKNKRKANNEKIFEIIKVPKKRKRQVDKAAQIAAKKISKKYKNIRFR